MSEYWFDSYRSDTVHTVSREAFILCLLSLQAIRDPWPVTFVL